MENNWNNLLPQEVISNPQAPYVYFNSLPENLKDELAIKFNSNLFNNITKEKIQNEDNAIYQAFSFLEEVIRSERGKEEAFIRYLKDKTAKDLEVQLPSLDQDWGPYMKDIQKFLAFGKTGITNLINESERLNINKTRFDQILEKDPLAKEGSPVGDAIGAKSKLVLQLLSFLNGDFNKNSNGYKIIQTIIMQYKDELLEFDQHGKLILDRAALTGVLEIITNAIGEYYASHRELFKSNKDANAIFDPQKIITLIESDETLNNNIKETIQRIKTIPGLNRSITDSLRLTSSTNNRAKKINISHFMNGKSLITDTDMITEQIWSALHAYKIPEEAIQIVKKQSDFAELDSMNKMIISGATAAFNTGKSQAKPDNIVAFLAIDPQKMNPANKENNKLQNLLSQLNNIYLKLEDVAKNVRQTNTTDYYKQQRDTWNTLIREIDKIIKKVNKTYQIISSCFLIEDSTKDYVKLYAKKEDGKIETGPHGGSLGPSLKDQIERIEVLTQAGAITMLDREWLIAAIINSGDSTFLSDRRPTLEDYLAMFAAILLFDSQLNIAAEAAARFKKSLDYKVSNTTHLLHLFSVNNGYYPLSYVLKLTYDTLKQGLGRIQDESRQGVQVHFEGFLTQPKSTLNSLEGWNENAAEALRSVKIKMSFLVNLQNTINNLFPNNSPI